ncbi:Rho guanine nucleotide exchange factor 37 [Phyllostomus discolor]|uniref:Rho guanine nucleotide exchange factor 37 n=1 Tax=Phyllostomus discolor TaxID=89673 RepID=A0A834DEV4_9CHIR|nr:Rho guanine nucleotide exchange factor 37 [Phyllostomus discolor]
MADRGADEPSSRTGSPDGESRVSEDRWSLHQRLAIRELIDTEASYVHMLQLCASDIRSGLHQLPQGDLDVLFSNTDDIIKVNSRLLQDLQETDSREEEQVQLIGKQKTRQLSALDSCGVVLSIWSLQNHVQSSRKMQLCGGLHLGSLKQQV